MRQPLLTITEYLSSLSAERRETSNFIPIFARIMVAGSWRVDLGPLVPRAANANARAARAQGVKYRAAQANKASGPRLQDSERASPQKPVRAKWSKVPQDLQRCRHEAHLVENT